MNQPYKLEEDTSNKVTRQEGEEINESARELSSHLNPAVCLDQHVDPPVARHGFCGDNPEAAIRVNHLNWQSTKPKDAGDLVHCAWLIVQLCGTLNVYLLRT